MPKIRESTTICADINSKACFVRHKSKFHLASHATSRNDTTRSKCRARRDERVKPCCSTSSTQPKCMGSTRRTCRVVTSQVEFWLCQALINSHNKRKNPIAKKTTSMTIHVVKRLWLFLNIHSNSGRESSLTTVIWPSPLRGDRSKNMGSTHMVSAELLDAQWKKQIRLIRQYFANWRVKALFSFPSPRKTHLICINLTTNLWQRWGVHGHALHGHAPATSDLCM